VAVNALLRKKKIQLVIVERRDKTYADHKLPQTAGPIALVALAQP
jgi:hypothetical protein